MSGPSGYRYYKVDSHGVMHYNKVSYDAAEAKYASDAAARKNEALAAGQSEDTYIDPLAYQSNNNDPDTQTAQLLKNQYDDYVKRFGQSEDELMGMSIYGTADKGAGMINSEIQDALGEGSAGRVKLTLSGAGFGRQVIGAQKRGYVLNALDASEQQQVRQQSRYGSALTAEQLQAQQDGNAMTRSLTTVDAANKIRQRVVDRSNAIATGLTPTSGRTIA